MVACFWFFFTRGRCILQEEIFKIKRSTEHDPTTCPRMHSLRQLLSQPIYSNNITPQTKHCILGYWKEITFAPLIDEVQRKRHHMPRDIIFCQRRLCSTLRNFFDCIRQGTYWASWSQGCLQTNFYLITCSVLKRSEKAWWTLVCKLDSWIIKQPG